MSQASQEEKILTSAIKIEQWCRRYKSILIAVAVVVFFGFAGYQVSLWYQAETIKKNYAIYESLLKDPQNSQKREELKATGSPLYDLFLLKEAMDHSDTQALKQLEASKDGFIGMIARYQNASLTNTQAALDDFLRDTDRSEPFKDILLLQKVYFLLKEHQIREAHALLTQIPIDSSVKSIARFFEHYGVTQTDTTTDENTVIDGVEIFQPSDQDADQDTGIENIQLLQSRNP